jgi:hypothetical protein
VNKDLIQKFLNKACWDEQAQHELEDWLNVEKFAELIVAECMEWCDAHATINGTAQQIRDSIKKHFGVEE